MIVIDLSAEPRIAKLVEHGYMSPEDARRLIDVEHEARPTEPISWVQRIGFFPLFCVIHFLISTVVNLLFAIGVL